MYVLPWHTREYIFDIGDPSSMVEDSEEIIQLVNQIDEEDPWVKENFGVCGAGEGLVFYPTHFMNDRGIIQRDIFFAFVWKSKGEKHTQYRAPPVLLEPLVLESVMAFVDLMMTPARIEQAYTETKGKSVGSLIGWLVRDIKDEGMDELDKSGLPWRPIASEISTRAQQWWKTKDQQ
eukprot:TRINITY_DN4056_c0_g1_i1.p2 TRINITY_DN4056_c0_g1~~TRINITY_DN4056_c0_g1_i1.p2  ORF type:complete len:177 (-),score=44.65 TRINITY_DN4056_c0_g1_i1:767-1297(-)